MSIKEKLQAELVNHGLWPQEAEAIVAKVEADPANEAMGGRWDDSLDGYPPSIWALVWLSAKTNAVAWIDANKPEHWARAMFAA